MLFESLHDKLLRLDDAVEVYPAHGAGSLCGRTMSTERSSTIGVQRATNHALQPMGRDAFVTMMTTALPEQPQYFARDAQMNRTGAGALAEIAKPKAMTAAQCRDAMRDGTLLLDVRPSDVYGPEHVLGSMNVGLDGQFASWAGALIAFERRIVLIASDAASVDEAVVRLARIGMSTVVGYVAGGIAAWSDAGFPLGRIAQISAGDLHAAIERGLDSQLIDVRRPGEIESGVAPEATPLTLASLESALDRIDRNRSTTLVCGSGYRSSIAASILESHGFTRIANVDGGMNAYRAATFPVVHLATA